MAFDKSLSLLPDPKRLTTDRIARLFVPSLLIVGAPRTGKFWGLREDVTEWADTASGGTVGLFPQPQENAPLFVQDLHAAGHARHIWFDQLDSVTAILPLICFVSSKNPNPYERAIENAQIRDSLIELLGRGRREPIEHQVLVMELATRAIDLCLAATCVVTLRHLLAVGKEGHPLYEELLDNCPDQEMVWFWVSLPKQGVAMRRELAALWRLLDQKFGHPQILPRDSREHLLQKLLEDAQYVAVEGGGSGRATSTYLPLVSMMATQIIRNHFSRTGEQLPTLVIADEIGFGLFSSFEKRALQQLIKAGFHYWAIAHSLRLLPDFEENTEALQAFQAFQFYKCPDWDTAMAAAKCAGGALDAYLEHHRDRRTMQRNDGFDVIPTKTTTASKGKSGDNKTESESTSRSDRLVPRHIEAVEETIRYMSLDDQFKMLASNLLKIGPRLRLICNQNGVSWEPVKELELPWIIEELGQVKLRNLLLEMHQRKEYIVPSIPTPVPMLSARSSGSTRRPSNTSHNGRNGHSTNPQPSEATRALMDVLKKSGRRRDVP